MELKTILGIGSKTLLANTIKYRAPVNVMFSVTNRCPSRCKYCDIPERKQKELSKSQVFDLINQLSFLGTKRLGLWGGEPLIREDIGEIIDYAKKKGLYVTMDSNGYLLPLKFDSLKNLDLLILSFDGNKTAHDKNREKGSFDKVIKAIKTASNRKKLWTITVLTKNNLDQVDYILDMAKKYNFKTTFQILHHSEAISSSSIALMPKNEEYKKVIKKLLQEKKKGAPIVSSTAYLKHLLKWQDYKKTYNVNKRKGDIPCYAGRLFCNVDTDGRVYPCVVLIEKQKALNFLDVGFKKAFDNIKEVGCSSCTASCLIEFNMMFSMRADVIMNWMKYT